MSIVNGFPGGGSGDIMKAIFKQLGETETFTNNMAQGAPISVSMSDGTTFVSSASSKYPGLYIKHKLTRTMILDTGYNYSYMCEVPGGALIGGKTGDSNMYYFDSATRSIHAITCGGNILEPRPMTALADDAGIWVGLTSIQSDSSSDDTVYKSEIGYIDLGSYTYTTGISWGSTTDAYDIKPALVTITPAGVIGYKKYQSVYVGGTIAYINNVVMIRKADMNSVEIDSSSTSSGIYDKGRIAQGGTKIYFAFTRTNASNPQSYVADYEAHTLTEDTNYLIEYLCETADYIFASGQTAIYKVAKADGSVTEAGTHVSNLTSSEWHYDHMHIVKKVNGGWLVVPAQGKTSNIVFIDEVTQTASNLLSGTFASGNYCTRIEKFAGGYLIKSAYSSTKPVYFYNESARTAVSLTGDTNAFYWTPGDRQSYIFITDAYRVYKFDVASRSIVSTAVLHDSGNKIVALVGTEDGCAVAMTKDGLYAIDPDGNAWTLNYYRNYSVSLGGAYKSKDAIYIYASEKSSSSADYIRYSYIIDIKEWRWFNEYDYLHFLIDYGDRYMERVV